MVCVWTWYYCFVRWCRNSDSWLWKKYHTSGPRASPFHSFNWHETGICWFGTYLTCCSAITLTFFFLSGMKLIWGYFDVTLYLLAPWQLLEMSTGLFYCSPTWPDLYTIWVRHFVFISVWFIFFLTFLCREMLHLRIIFWMKRVDMLLLLFCLMGSNLEFSNFCAQRREFLMKL